MEGGTGAADDEHGGSDVELERTAERTAAVDALAAALAAHGGGRVGVEGVAGDLARRLRRTFAPTPRLIGRKVTAAYTWERPDRRDVTWWPQGITTSALTGLRERLGHDVLLTSWYSKAGAGARLSVVDVVRRRYEHVLLVEPVIDPVAGGVELRPVAVHAGGLVWHGPYVHVAATARGLLTCRTDDLMRVPAGAPFETHGHRYVLPVAFAHRGHAARRSDRLRFSFVTLDRSSDPVALVVGEYGSPDATRRIARFPLDPATALPAGLDAPGARVRARIDGEGEPRMQGIAVVDGVTYVTRSRGPRRRGSVYVGRPGAFREHREATPVGPEDLVWWPETRSLWSVSEHPRQRWVFAMRRRGLPG